MPAEAIAAPPAPAPSPTPAPTPAPSPSGPIGGDAASAPIGQQSAEQKATAEIESILNRGSKKKDQAVKGKEGEGSLEWKTAPKQFREAHEKLRVESTNQIQKLEQHIKEINSKVVASPGDAKKVADLEKQISDIQKGHEEVLKERDEVRRKLAETDYSKSDEFKRDYVEKWQSYHADSVNRTLRFQAVVKGQDGEGDKFRPATAQDFEYVRSLPVELRRKAATERFGENGNDVVDDVKELERIARSGQEAIARHAQDYEKKSSERKLASQSRQSKLEERRQAIQQAIEDGMPVLSLKHHEADPDAAKALQEGYEMADSGLKQMLGFNDESDVEAHAQRLSTFRSLIGSASLYALQNDRLTDKVAELETELAKYRKSDPGATTPTPPSEKNEPDEVGTVEEEAKKFKRA